MKLKELRINNNITQFEAAKIANCSQSNYSKYELNKLNPDINTLIRLADYYKVSLDYLCERDWNNKAYLELWKLSDEQKANMYIIEQLNKSNNLIASGYLLRLLQEQRKII